MPRRARLDIPGLLQHVIVRGIERRAIFFDDIDRSRFVEKLFALLAETDTDCFAWALIPNHFHLLLRPNRLELKQVMRRLLTGYAIAFNKRHDRSGHVFQNRYKSIVCEKETYLLELVRYIHLNPLRAELVPSLAALGEYPWCGHGVLLGKRERPGQVVDETLAHFGTTFIKSRQTYAEFMEKGALQGRREELVGGGQRRSRGLLVAPEDDLEISDDRVLGSGNFVERLRRKASLQDRMSSGMLLPELAGRVEEYFGLARHSIERRSKNQEVMAARDVLCYLATRVLRHSGTDVGAMLNVQRSAVALAVRRGEKLVEGNEGLVESITGRDVV